MARSFPTVSQSVETTAGNKLAVKYASISFGQGKFLESAGD